MTEDITTTNPEVAETHEATVAGTETTHEQESGILGSFGVSPSLFLAQLLNFAIVVFVLTKWVFKPLLKTMDERKKTIDDGIKRSEESERVLVEARASEQEIVRNAHAQGKDIVEEAKERGEMEKQKRIEISKTIITRQLEDAKLQALHEAGAERDAVRRASAELVGNALEKVAPGAIDEKKQRLLIAKAIEELESHV